MIRNIGQSLRTIRCLSVSASAAIFLLFPTGPIAAGELRVDDFRFDGPLGSAGATIERVDTNHFKVVLGHAPEHPT